MFTAEITLFCESIRPGCEFRALFYDRATEEFYGGSGPTALHALAWCMDEYIGRVVHGFGVEPARSALATPGSRFASAPRATPARTIEKPTTPAPNKRHRRKAA